MQSFVIFVVRHLLGDIGDLGDLGDLLGFRWIQNSGVELGDV